MWGRRLRNFPTVKALFHWYSNLSLITDRLNIPTIGIGSSINCDGQILVTDDMLGLSGFYPKFVKKYVNLNRIIEKAVKKYTREVKLNIFPTIKNFLNGSKHRKKIRRKK